MGRIARALSRTAAAGLAAACAAGGAARAQDAPMTVRCYAADRPGGVFYSSAGHEGSASHLDGDYLAFIADLTHRYRVDVDEESGACIVEPAQRAANAKVDAAWRPFRDTGKRRVDTGWKPDRVRR